jgi:hypothetical protein
MPRSGCIATFATVLAAGAVTGGCGSAELQKAPHAKQVAPVTAASRVPRQQLDEAEDEPVARIGDRTITLGALRHWISIDIHGQAGAPEPPDYAACIAYLHAESVQTTAQLREVCRREYDGLMKPALSSLIHDRWLTAEAAEAGLKADEPKLKRESSTSGPHGEEVRQTLETTDETASDVKFKLLVDQLSGRIYRKLELSTPIVTSRQVSSYYMRHKRTFVAPEQRDLYILRTASNAAAKKAKREVEGGTSFAKLVGKTSLEQPTTAKDGLLLGLRPNNFGEPPLNKAIFSAPLNALRGPVEISLGYYIFNVLHSHPARQRSLAEVRPEIVRLLHQQRRDRIVTRFVAAFRKKWTSRTTCAPGYVVKYCRQYRGSKAELREDAKAL